MRSRNLISLWVLLALVLGQFVLAQHSATHIEHGFSQEIIAESHHEGHDHDHHHGDEEKRAHECSECFLIQSLQVAFYNAPATLFVSLNLDYLAIPEQYSLVLSLSLIHI